MNTKKHKKCGFTLLEALFASMLIGLVVVSLAAASGAFTMVNSSGIDMSTGEFLIEEIREMTCSMTFDELVALGGTTYSPPVDLRQTAMSEFSTFSQVITVEYLEPSSLDTVSGDITDFIRFTVSIIKDGRPVNSTSWVRTNL